MSILNRLSPYSQLISGATIFLSIGYVCFIAIYGMGRYTYISENALMPDYASPQLSENDLKEFNMIVSRLNRLSGDRAKGAFIRDYLSKFTGEQSEDSSSVDLISGKVYGTRSDGSESLLLVAPYLNSQNKFNLCGISLALTLIQSFNQKKYWSRDVCLVVPGVGAPKYSDVYNSLKEWSGRIVGWDSKYRLDGGQYQGGIILEVIGEGESCKLENEGQLIFQGSQGLLPNLDLINTITLLHKHRGGNLMINHGKFVNQLIKLFPNQHIQRILQLFSSVLTPASTNTLNTPLLDNRIDSLTIKYVSSDDASTDNDSFAILQQASLLYRSLNNILEHLHQSFFTYLLPTPDEFYSISIFLAAAIFPIAGLLFYYILALEGGEFHFIYQIISHLFTLVLLLLQTVCCLLFPHSYRILNTIPTLIILIVYGIGKRYHYYSEIDFRPVSCLFAALILLSTVLINFSQAFLVGILIIPILIFPSLHSIPFLLLLSLLIPMPSILLCMQPLFILSALSPTQVKVS